MNERIFELAKQADLVQWDTLPSRARTPDHESVVKAKKFAELIIKDCITSISALDDDAPYDEWTSGYASAIKSAAETLEERFGIKE